MKRYMSEALLQALRIYAHDQTKKPRGPASAMMPICFSLPHVDIHPRLSKTVFIKRTQPFTITDFFCIPSLTDDLQHEDSKKSSESMRSHQIRTQVLEV